MPTRTYAHYLSSNETALLTAVERAEAVFMEFGLDPDRRIRSLSVADARRLAESRYGGDGPEPPAAYDDDPWLPHLAPELFDAAVNGGAERLFHAGVVGLGVLDRVITEQTRGHAETYLQIDDREADVPTGYSVYECDARDGIYRRRAERRLF